MYKIDSMPNQIDIGFTGEKGFRKIEIDMTPWMETMPDGVPSIVHIRPGEGADDAYIVATTFEDNILTWTVSDGDLGETEGSGIAQIWLEKEANDSIVKRGKSILVATQVRGAINNADDTVPEAQTAWMEQMTALKVATVNAKTAAETAETNAASSASDSEAWADGTRGGQTIPTTDPAYNKHSAYYASVASSNRNQAKNYKEDSEAYAVGKRNGTDVDSGDEAYHNNSKYYAGQAASLATDAYNYASAAGQSAYNAGAAKDTAISAKNAILGMTVTATGLAAGSSPTVSYSNGVMAFGIPKGDKGDKGATGDTGSAGADGTDATIKSQTTYYATSSSGTTAPSSGWDTTIPSVTPGDFLWVKHIVTWYDDETSTIVFCAKHGGSGGGGTIESITMNGSTLPIVSGVVDLGTVITAHQDISGKLNNDVAAEEFSTSGTYAVGEYVMHNGELYICKRDVMEQSWSTQDWTKVDIGTRLKTLNSIKPSIPLSFTSGNLTKFTISGDLEDSGISANDVAEKPSTWTSGNLASLDNYGNPVDSGVNPEEKADCSTIGIVETGDTATHAISAGQYVIWKGNLYTADTAIAVNDTLASTGGSKNLTAVSGGLGAEVASLNSNLSNLITGNYNNKYLKFPGNIAVAFDTVTKNVSGNTIAITFPAGLFAEAPTVVASTGAGSYRTPIYVEDVTKNGFTIFKDNGNSGNIWIRWIAIGKY